MELKKRKIEARISERDKYRLEEKAAEEGLSTSSLLRKIVLDYLDGKKFEQVHSNKKTEKSQKENKIAIRVSNEQYIKIAQCAKEAHLSMSDYIRKRALGEKIVVIDGLKAFVYQLRKIGNNLNQLTNLANEGRIYSVDLSAIKQYIDDLWKELKDFLEAVKE